jgi:hypothetical protein
MFTREFFEQQRAAVRRVDRRDGRVLAVVAVGLGLGQLVVIRWADAHLERGAAVRLEGAVFLAYAALVGWLVWRLQRQLRRVRPMCPNCAASLEGMSLRVAAATGRCDTCGAQIIE